MTEFVTAGRKLVPSRHIAFAEPFDPAANPQFHPAKSYAARLVLLGRDSVLTAERVEAFAAANGFRWLVEDRVAINPAVHFTVEMFQAEGEFRPKRAYRTRLRWRDGEGNEQSKLLVTAPEAVLSAIEGPPPVDQAAKSAGARRGTRRRQAGGASVDVPHP